MPNDAVFNQSSQPIYTEQVNTYAAPGIGAMPETDAAESGLLFTVPFTATVTTSAPLVIQIANAGGSGRTMYLSRIIASSATAAVTLTLLRNATVTGSTATPVNMNFGSSTTSVMTARTATAAPTGTPTTVTSVLLAAAPVIVEYSGRIIVPPGNSLTLTITISTGSAAATGAVSWWET